MLKSILTFLLFINTTLCFALSEPYAGISLGIAGYGSKPGLVTDIYTGYDSFIDQQKYLYLAGEANASIARFSKYNMNYGLGASLLPGIHITNETVFFARAGINAIYNPHIIEDTNLGYQTGIGVKTQLSEIWDARGEYSYSNIRNNGEYTFGLIYHFM